MERVLDDAADELRREQRKLRDKRRGEGVEVGALVGAEAARRAHFLQVSVGCYAISLYKDDVSRLNEALAILEEVYQTARRVFGHAHPVTMRIQHKLSQARECQATDDAADAAR